MNNRRVLLVGDGSREPVRRSARELAARLSGLAEVVGEHLALSEPLPKGEVDLAIVLGGDGTMLWAARALAPRGVPLAGVNTGKFGFLAAFSLEGIVEELPELLDGSRQPGEWLMLEVRTSPGDVAAAAARREPQGRSSSLEAAVSAGEFHSLALNDVVLTGAQPARMVLIGLAVDGEPVNTYAGDGLTVSTPVGSTAYSLSAGGPIVDPLLEAMVVTPICAHSLSNRPLVVPPQVRLTITLAGRAERGLLTVDGQEATTVTPGQAVHVRRADVRARVFTTASRTYFQTLRDKLGWGGQPNYAQGASAD